MRLILFCILFLSHSHAETVLWKATGTLTQGTGLFQRDDLSANDPVTIRMTYDDQAVQDVVTQTFGRIDSDYRQDINLKITITIGSNIWEGSVGSALEGLPYTFFTRVKDPFPTPESLEVQLSSADQGTFSSFPFQAGEGTSFFLLDFRGANASLLDAGISVADIHPEHFSPSTGKISTGTGNELTFAIEPSSVEVLFEADEVVPPTAPLITASNTSENLTLSWQSDFRFRYRVESTSDLSSDAWTEVETRNGTDTIITRSYPLVGSPLFYRVVAIERPPLG